MVKIVLKTADWDDALQTHNALVEETSFVDCDIQHEFGRPAKVTVYLADKDGTIAQKYDVDAAGDSVYVGPGRAYLYDDDDAGDASILDGRIVRALPDHERHMVTLECEDWLSQLDDRRIDYDMRQPLNADNLRQSEAHSDADYLYVGPSLKEIIDGAKALDGAAYTDETAEALSAAANDMTLLPAIPAVNDAYYFGWYVPQSGFTLNIGTQGDGTWTITWEYWNGAWTALSGVSDGTGGFTLGDEHVVSWTLPADWTTVAVDGTTLYWVRARVSAYTAVITQPLGTQVTSATYYMFDDDMSWVADTYNNMYVCLTGGMAGSITVGSGPYSGTNTGADTYSNDPHLTWVDDTNEDGITDNDGNYTLDYAFRMYVGNNTPSDLYVHDSISAARIILCYLVTGDGTCKLQIDDKTDGWIDLEDLTVGFGTAKRLTVTVPTEYLSSIIDANGIATVRFAVTWGSGNVAVAIKYIRLEVDVDTTGYSSAIAISDTTSNRLKIDTDLTAAATCIWEGIPYAIAKPIYKHIDTGESGTLITDGDTIYAMTAAANIEHTSGISTRHYIERTRLEILQDLALQDKSVFWTPLGTVDLTLKSTFNNAAPTALTDASFLNLQGDWDYKSMFNEYTVYGAKIGTYQIEQTDSDATSLATYGIYRTKILKSTGVLSDYDCAQMADKLVARDKDVHLFLEAEIGGLSALRLGDEVSITSTYLGLTAQVYTITHWQFNLKNYRTRIRLHPRASTTGYTTNVSFTQVRDTIESQRTTQQDRYVTDLHTQEWA